MSKASEFEETHDASYLRRLFKYEPETGKLFWREDIRRPRVTPGMEAGSLDKQNGDRKVMIDGVLLKVHRVVFCIYTGNWPLHDIAHYPDPTPSNNRISNLHDWTESQNMRDRKPHSSNTSGYPGVTWDRCRRKWRAQIQLDGRRKNLGRFDTAEQAFEAYVSAALTNGFTHRHIYGVAA